MYVHVRVLAGAKRETFEKKGESRFVVRVKEAAEHNLANRRVQELLAVHFCVSAAQVRLVSGHHRPSKIFLLP